MVFMDEINKYQNTAAIDWKDGITSIESNQEMIIR